MIKNKQKLELTWIGKDKQPELEPRILIEDPEKSYGDSHTDNMLIHGDNLLALKALEQDYSGKIKCIYIDPPYNTGAAFEQYEDGIEHSLWLSLIKERLVILWRLLHPSNGSLWISIDDREMAYLKIVLDEICGRNAFVASNIWQKRYSRENREAIGDSHEYVLVYAKSKDCFKKNRRLLPLGDKQLKLFKNPDNDTNGLWQSVSLTAQGYRPNQMYGIVGPNGKTHYPPEGSCWKIIESNFQKELLAGKIYFGKDGNGVPRRKNYLEDAKGLVPWTWWPHDEVGHTDEAKKEQHYLFDKSIAFETPKPERLIQRILHIASNEGDIVLDSFLGSGTTSAVAHKMGRKWIGIELGDHCDTHCVPRLKKVCDGTDQGGISKAFEWKGGGGFKYYELAPSLLNQDKYGNWIISKEYNPNMVASAMSKHEGFKYCPSKETYWKQGQSTENDFIFTTTTMVTGQLLDSINEEMKESESLLVCCKSFQKGCGAKYANITIKKIPKMLLGKCEFGKEDYSLNIVNMPTDPDAPDFQPTGPLEVDKPKKKIIRQKEIDAQQPDLFSDIEGVM